MIGQNEVIDLEDDLSWEEFLSEPIETEKKQLTLRLKGGEGSGNFGHGGRPGEVGGSASSGMITSADMTFLGSKYPKELSKMKDIFDNLPESHKKLLHSTKLLTYVVTEVEKGDPDSYAGGYYENTTPPRIMLAVYLRKNMRNGMMKEIYTHELGHAFEKACKIDMNEFVKLDSVQKGKSKLSERARENVREHFAEAYRIFVTRPESLKIKEPDVYAFLDGVKIELKQIIIRLKEDK